MLQSSRQVKKLVIKNFKGQRIPEDFESSSWTTLRTGLHDIFAGRHESICLETLYRTCEDVCRCRMAHPLYSKVYAECESHAQSYAPQVLQLISSDVQAVELLKAVNHLWQDYTGHVKIVSNVFLYLDRVFALNRPELLSIWDLCMTLFRANAVADPSVRSALVGALLRAVEEDREAEISQEASAIADAISMLSDLKLTEEWLRQEMIQATDKYFEGESLAKVGLLSVPEYLDYALRRIDDEIVRYGNYGLEATLSAELMQHVRNCIFVTHLDRILANGLGEMVSGANTVYLKSLHDLCQETDCAAILKDSWAGFIKTVGGKLIAETSREELIVGDLISFKDNLDHIVAASFAGSAPFMEAEKESFESFMNSRQNRPAELISKFADYQLRGGSGEALTDAQLELILEKIITVFRFIQGKDYFEVVFKKDLARRLLFARSLSMEAEKSFVGRLKQECGSAFTSRLEGMFKDMDLSKETMSIYQTQRAKSLESRDFAATTAASGLWPYPPLIQANIPDSISREQESFEAFYRAQHKGRLLNWHQGLGNCILKANFPLGTKELQLSIPQALVLLCFNDVVARSYSELQLSTGLDDATLARALQSLACGKVNVLVKPSKGREISVHDTFTYNVEFTSKHTRIRISALADRETVEEPMMSPTEGSSDRQYQIDAAIVRSLKVSKRLEREQLISMTSELLKMPISGEEFARRSLSLIDREFIGQDSDDPSYYVYLA